MKPNPQFLHLSWEEFTSIYLTTMPSAVTGVDSNLIKQAPEFLKRKTPDLKTVYYVNLANYSPTVYNQNKCGNCYAFATIETINIRNNVKATGYPFLSIQQFTDCSSFTGASNSNSGCAGGSLLYSVLYNLNYGVVSAANYPLYAPSYSTGVNHACASTSGMAKYKIPVAYIISDTSCVNHVNALSYNYSVLTGMSVVNGIQYYSNGLVTCPYNGNLNHAVVFVGYYVDTSISSGVFILKNSWGTSFGVGGYFYVAMNNQCNLCLESYITGPN